MRARRPPAKKHIPVDEETYNRIIQRAHYGQTQGGVVRELLDLADQIEGHVNPSDHPTTGRAEQ